MLHWIRNFYLGFLAKRMTTRSVEEAYVRRNTKYLRKVYRYGYSYHKRLAVKFLGKIPQQRNFDFLLKEMKMVTEIKLRAYIFQALLQLSVDKHIQVREQDLHYLSRNHKLLNFIGTMPTRSPRKDSPTPISFDHRRRDLLGMLQDMQGQFEMY